jgi:hypothetical protein
MTDTHTPAAVQPMGLIWDGDRAPLAKAFVTAQKAMEAVKKAATNPAFRTKYADLSEVVEAVVPALNAAGVGVIQNPGYDGEFVTVQTTFIHESGASVTSTLRLRPTKPDPQGVGSAITYGRRYGLLAMSGAAPEDDDGNSASEPRHKPTPVPTPEPRPATLADRADALTAALNAATDPATLSRVWAKASALCAELDMKDPDRLATLTAIHDGLRDQLDANPFAREAA